MSKTQQQQVADEFDAYRDNYQQAVNEALSFSGLGVDRFVRAKAHHLTMEVDRHFGVSERGLSIIDVGCGIGQYHSLIGSRFDRVVGVDVSNEALARAKQENPQAEYVSYEGGRLPFDDATFDVSFAICVLHHVPVPVWENFTREMYRVVRPGGLALLFEHNPYNPLTRKVVSDCPFDRDAVLVRQSRAKELFANAGFSDIRVDSILTLPAVDGVMKSIDRMFAGLPFGTQYCLSARRT